AHIYLFSYTTRRSSDLDRLDLFLKGIDTANSIASLEVDPATLRADQRELIWRHLFRDGTGEALYVVHDPVRARQSDEVVPVGGRSEEHTSELQSPDHLV